MASIERPRLNFRTALLSVVLTLEGLFATSCLTPDAEFDDPVVAPSSNGDGDKALGGQGGSDVTTNSASCTSGIRDGAETDVDCGGGQCDPCEVGDDCERDRDCADSICAGGECELPSCTDGEKTGDETDVDCGGSGCGACNPGERCSKNSDCDSLVCSSGECAEPACNDRIQNGNETDIDCGGDCGPCAAGNRCVIKADCLQPPVDDPATTSCVNQICILICPAGFGDCNQDAADGCETNVNTDASHCGACSDVCAPDHAVGGKCVGGDCLIDFEAGGCAGSWADCNGDPGDGCEIDANSDVDNCGACFDACSGAHGLPSCAGGACQIACDGSFDNCDGDARSNGCEVDTGNSALHCGTCDNACTAMDGQVPACDSGIACVGVACDDPADCGGVQPCGACDPDQTCNDHLDSTNNCGGCGITCDATNATVACNDRGGWTCEIDTCVDSGGADYEDCDGVYDNGCETDVHADINTCGGCVPGEGTDCEALLNDASLSVASITCNEGKCEINGCDGSRADCDGDPTNGCEVETSNNDSRCGGCLASDKNPGSGVDCTMEDDSTGSCINSACEVNTCDLTADLTGTGCDPKTVDRLVDGDTGMSGEFSANWNATNLTLVFDVFDSNGFNDSPDHWQDDGVEVYLDIGNEKAADFDNNDYQLLLGWNDSTVQGNGNGLNRDAVNVSQSSISGGYRLTVTIPWNALGGRSAPAQGTTIGFDVALNDDWSGGDRNGQLMWVGNNQNFMDPFRWGNLKLN